MADFTTANLIQAVSPGRYSTAVPTNQPITVTFFRDMDSTTFSDATIALEVVGTVLRVPVTYSYLQRVLTITPTTGLSPTTTYKCTLVGDTNPVTDSLTNHITGIKDIAGNGMVGLFTWAFTTAASASPVAPTLISPQDQNALGRQPVFAWSAVTSAATYQVQVSLSNAFDVIYWPLTTDTYNQVATTVTPARSFDINKEYWWRVRGVAANGTLGSWSKASSFFYGDSGLGTVTPDDAPMGIIANTQIPVAVSSACPTPGTANLNPDQYPANITVTLTGPIDVSNLSNANFWMTSSSVDGFSNDAPFKPIFSPTLNGSQYGSGGITAQSPVDQYQQVALSGTLQAQPSADQSNGITTTFSLAVPNEYWRDNNRYTVHLDIPELQNPLEWSFTSRWTPVFAGIDGVRAETDHFSPELSDEEILYHTRQNSLYALFIQVYPPTQLNGESWIYNPPISFDVNNPPFFAREYVRLKTAADLLDHKYQETIFMGKSTLGDFTVDKSLMALKQNMVVAVENLKAEYLPYLDKLMGHTKRGYARGEWAERGERSHVNYSWGYPFGNGGGRGGRF